MTRSSISCSTRTASAMTSICSTRSCVNGRTTTITIARTELSVARLRTSVFLKKRERKCYQGLRTLQKLVATGLQRAPRVAPVVVWARGGEVEPMRVTVVAIVLLACAFAPSAQQPSVVVLKISGLSGFGDANNGRVTLTLASGTKIIVPLTD